MPSATTDTQAGTATAGRTAQAAQQAVPAAQQNVLPATGLVRLWQIIGDKERGVPPVIPVSKSTWWNGVKAGRFPRPIKLGATTCWNVQDIRQLLDSLTAGGTAGTVPAAPAPAMATGGVTIW